MAMYQPPRVSTTRAAASSATSPRTNPLRSNNDRDEMSERRRSQDPSAALERVAGDGGSGLGEAPTPDEEVKYMRNLNSIVQQFFIKGALTLVGSRVPLPPAKQRDSDEVRNNRWFNLVLPESDALAEYTSDWRGIDVGQERPSPMVIEIYLDLTELTRSQKLIILDENGKRWDVAEALNPSFSASSTRPESRTEVSSQVMLERWVISLDGSPTDSAMQLDSLSSVYKRGIPLFRSLYTFGRTMPAFRYSRRLLKQPSNQPSVKLNYRILNGHFKSPRRDTLEIPLAKSEDEVTESYSFEPLQCSAGTLNISVSYRSNCDFRVDDTESLMSSHFMASDDNYFRPSLPGRQTQPAQVPSSVPNAKHEYQPDMVEQGQVYGSLSTFHKTGAAHGSSPLSAIRANRDGQSPDTPPSKLPPNQRLSTGSRSSMRSETAPIHLRRPSVSFQPFKAGSLASSPNINVPPSPGTSYGRTTGPSSLTHTRNRPSLTTLPQQVLRTPNLPNETAIASSASSSPKPAPINRYSSSFSHRRSRFSSTGSKGDDDQNSSGKQSASSSAQRGSDLINESQRASSGSIEQTEDDKSIQDFIHLLEAKKELKSFRPDSATRDVAMKRTTAALSKYRGMRDSNIALSDSMSSSLLLHRSSSSSSRQLSSVPPMIHGTSVSTSSSPGKPISPHTPHTPAIPSRLSDNLTIHYGEGARRSRSRSQRRRQSAEPTREDDSSDTTTHDTGTTAIDIPTSPRAWHIRRSSSVSQQHRALNGEPDLYGIRSASLPADERTELSMSELLRVNIGQSSAAPTDEDPSPNEGTEEETSAYPFPDSSSRPSSMIDQPVQQLFRNRLNRGNRRGSPTSERGSRYSASSRLSAQTGEEEELIFHLSELGSASRRSLEEARGGASGSAGRSGRGGSWGYEPPRQ